MVKIGIIGGSGLNDPQILEDAKDIEVETPYGKPSSPLKLGKINNVDIVLLSRHGRQHTIPPTRVNFRANVFALKQQGCTHIIATTACGSLREEIGRGDFVVLDQFIDFTRHRHITFYDEFEPHRAMHTPMAVPFSEEIRNALAKSCEKLGLQHHKKGTVITIEGPRFSTKAESKMFRLWGADVINMSIAPEVTLANEAGIPYGAVAMSTDYDCWKESEEAVTWEEVLKVFNSNVEKVTRLLTETISLIAEKGGSEMAGSMNTINKNSIDYKKLIREVPDFPKKGILFYDITTLLKDSRALKQAITEMAQSYKGKQIDKIVGIESRGFIFGSLLANELGCGFVPARKPGKLPAKSVREAYSLEYGTDAVEIHEDAVKHGENILIVDDLLATGGTASATCRLVEKLGGKVAGCCFMIELDFLNGRQKLENYDIFSLLNYDK